jgi:hypothetical protein
LDRQHAKIKDVWEARTGRDIGLTGKHKTVHGHASELNCACIGIEVARRVIHASRARGPATRHGERDDQHRIAGVASATSGAAAARAAIFNDWRIASPLRKGRDKHTEDQRIHPGYCRRRTGYLYSASLIKARAERVKYVLTPVLAALSIRLVSYVIYAKAQ